MLRLKRGEDRRLRAGHLWVFSNEVDIAATPLTAFAPGDHARVHDYRDQFLGYAYVNPHALICARILSRSPVHPIDRSLLVHRLKVALALRERHYAAPYYRLVFGEGDGLPGLVLDRYGEVIVGQIATAGMEALARGHRGGGAAKCSRPRRWYGRTTAARASSNSCRVRSSHAVGRDARTRCRSSRACCSSSVPMAAAQKTGWFYDQVANRELFRRLMWPGARVLDVCSYAGAWAITAHARGAREALCVDSSEAALAVAERNAAANGVTVKTRRGDAFDVLDELQREGERFDVVVLDPPAFIKRRKDMPRGQAAYRKLNQLAMRLLERDALLVSCSCSFHLAADDLAALIQAAARHNSRFVQVLAAAGRRPIIRCIRRFRRRAI